jgi:hypothetical protein
MPGVRTQRSIAEPGGASGSNSSPSERSLATVARDGTAPPSAKETRMPLRASCHATTVMSRAGTRTTIATSG